MEWDHKQPLLSPDEKAVLLSFSKETLVSVYSHREDVVLEDFERHVLPNHPHFSLNLSCFVTLYSGEKNSLRGCVGSLTTSQALYENVWEYTLAAAFSDSRFPPVEENELGEISVGISVLGPEMPLRKKEDLIIGKHGLSVSHGKKRGVLLAKVASEWHWDRSEFLKQTCIKAGLDPHSISEYNFTYFEEISF